MDENVTGLNLAATLNARIEQYGCKFVTFPRDAHQGAPDEDVPSIARAVGATALLSINVQDFGAKDQYFRALVDAGVSVVSLRIRSSDTGDREYITNTLLKHVRKIARTLKGTSESVVVSVDRSNARSASLREILDRELS